MIYNVRPSILGGGGTITSFIRTMIDTHKNTKIFFPNRERFGLKIEGHGAGLLPESWNE